MEHVSVRIRSPFFYIIRRFNRFSFLSPHKDSGSVFNLHLPRVTHKKKSNCESKFEHKSIACSTESRSTRVRSLCLPLVQKSSVSFTKKRRNIANINKTPSPAVAAEITTIFHLLRSRSTRQIVVNLSTNYRRNQATDNFVRLSILIQLSLAVRIKYVQRARCKVEDVFGEKRGASISEIFTYLEIRAR